MDTNYAATYAAMADEELLALVADSDELTDEARKALWTELRRRGMEQQAQDTYENRPKQPASPATPPPNLVSVAYFDNVIHANLAKTKLTSEGIQCYLADEHVVRMNLFYSLAVGRIRLMVRESDRAHALEALRVAGDEPSPPEAYSVGVSESLFRARELKQVSRILLLLMLIGLLVTVLTLLSSMR